MFKKSWLYASVATVALMGCASTSTQEGVATPGCTPGICRVEITIAANCGFTIKPDPLPVGMPRGPKIIEWEISTSNDFVFRTDGIVIKQPDGEFDGPNLSSNRKNFRLNNRHTKPGNYFYWIHVEGTGTNSRKCSIDPLIVNE